MVAIVTGSGQGLVKSSLAALGSQGEIGTAKLGQNGSTVTVNAANGNLIIQSQDEMLFGVGLDDAITNTYNSKAAGWQESYQRKVSGLTGTANTSGSTVTHTTGDGSTVVYTYNTTLGVYVGNERGGAYDTLSFNSSTNRWTWQDGKTRVQDVYDNANSGRLIQSIDTSANAVNYTYTGSQLTKITTANGDYTSFVYTGSLLTSVVTSYTNASGLQTATRVRYGYDGSNRLTTVTTDLSPNDNSIADGKTYVTTYTYINTSNNIGTITQSDGTSLTITYDSNVRVASVTQTTASGVSNVTYLTYGTGRTMVTDQQGNVTTLVYDSNNQLVQLIPPSSSPEPGTQFAYDANGNLTYSGPVGDPNFSNLTANWGETSDAGVTTTKSTEIDGGVQVYRQTTNTTPAANWAMRLGQSTPVTAAVAQGQNVQFSVYTASSRASQLYLCVLWRDASNVAFAGDIVSTIPTGGTLDANGLANAKFASGTFMPRAGAAYAELYVYAVADGTGPVSVAIAQPSVTVVGGTGGDPNFTNIAQNWGDVWTSSASVTTTQSTEVDGGVNVYRRQSTTTPASGWAMNLGQSAAARTAVTPGQSVTLSAFAATSGASSAYLIAAWWGADGYIVGTTQASTIATGGTLGASGLSTAAFARGTVTAPAGAVSVELFVQGIANGTGVLNVAIAQPSVSVAAQISTSTPQPSYVYAYDSNGNRLTMTDALGNRTDYAYDGANQLLTKTEAANSSSPLTTRYVYDSASRLVYVVTPRGDVTQYIYNTNGTQQSVIRYTGNLYTTAGTPTSSAMDSWVGTTDRTQTQRTDTTYDARGLVNTVTTYGQTDSAGLGVASSASITTYIYDQAGLLLSRKLSSSTATETFAYDGLGRTISATDFNGKLTQTVYTNTASGLQTAVTLANGTVRTSVYDKAGELVSVSDSGGGLTATTTYVYDSVGNLIRTTDPTGLSTYYVYDALGHKVADVAADGAIVTYAYNANDQLVSTTRYATLLTAAQLTLLANESATSAPVRLASIMPAASANDRWSWTVYDADGRRVEDIDAWGAVTAYSYDAAGRLIATTAYANLLPASTVTGFKTAAPTGIVLPSASATDDRTTRSFYNADDQLVGTLDADGYLTEVVYDAAGRKVRTIAHATQTLSANWASGTLAQLQADAGSSSNDIYHWWVYDGRGLLRAEIDGEGNTTRYDSYTAHGDAGTIIKGQVISTATLIATPPTLAGLPAPSGALEITSLSYDQYGHVLTKSITLTGGSVETTTYAYDPVYNLISQATVSSSSATGAADGRTVLARFDGLGRKALELTGNGVAKIAALGANPTQAQIDAIWAGNQIKYDYDAAGRLIAQTDSDNRRTLFYYDVDGRLTFRIDGTGNVVRYTHNAFGETSDVTTYTNRIASGTLAGLTGGQITATLLNAVTLSATDSYSHVNFSTNGVVANTTDALGAVTSYAYNAFGEVTLRTDPLSSGVTVQTGKTYSRRGLLLTSTADVGGLALLTSYQYDAFGRNTQVTDSSGTLTKTTYDRAGRVKTQVDGLNLTTSYTYDGLGHVLTTTDATGAVTTYAYSLFDRQITVTDPANVVTTTTKNAYGQTVRIVDGANAATTFEYDADGNLTRTTDALGNTTTQVFSSADVMKTSTDARGITTTYTYDGAARVLTKVVDSAAGGLALTTTWSYDGKGQTVTVTDPAGMVTVYGYDLDGHKVAQTVDAAAGGLQLTTLWAYDQAGRTVTETSTAGRVTKYVYDKANRMTQSIVDPNGLNLTTQLTYDADGNLVMTIDPAGNVTRSVYDADNRLAFTIDAVGAVTGYTYDNDGRLNWTTQYAVKSTSSGVQTLAQMQSWATANTGANDLRTLTGYDLAGRLVYSLDAAGYVTSYLYDSANRLVQQVRYPPSVVFPSIPATPPAGSEIIRYAYDANGRKVFTIDAVGAVTRYYYDNGGLITRTQEFAVRNTSTGWQSLTQMQTWATANASGSDLNSWSGYDAAGRLTYTIDPDNYVTGYLYDADGRVVQKTRYPANTSVSPLPSTPPAGSQVTRFVYDAAGRNAFTINPDGSVTGYVYDNDGNVTGTTLYATLNTSSGVQTRTQMQAWLSANSNAVANNANNRTTATLYDGAGRVSATTEAMGFVTGYSYDAAGRVVQQVRYPSGTQANALPATLPAGSIVTRYVYDGAGQKAFDIDGLGAVTAYTYDNFGNVKTTVQYATLNTSTGVQSLTQMQSWASAHAADGGNRTTSATYDNNGRLVTSTDALGYRTDFEYDFAGRVTKKTQYATLSNTLPRVTQYAYDTAGHLTDVTDALGIVTHKVYDTWGRMTSETAAYGTSDAATTQWTYDSNGWVTSTTTAAGATTTNQYDSYGEVVKTTDPNGNSAYFYYDAMGRRTWQIDPQGYAALTSYDFAGEVLSVTRYSTAVTVNPASPSLPTVPVNAAYDNTTSFSYYKNGWLSGSTDGNGYATSYTYDYVGNRTSMTNAVGGVTTYSYNARGEMLTQATSATALAPAVTTAYAYDAFGNRTQMVEAQGRSEQRITNYIYDAKNRLVQQYGDATPITSDFGAWMVQYVTPAQSFAYDAFDNQIAAQDANGNITQSYYDKLNRKTAEVSGAGVLTQWAYDARGNALSKKVYGDVLQAANDADSSVAQIYRMYAVGLGRLPVDSEVSYWLGVLAANANADQPAVENMQRDDQGHAVDPTGERLGALEATFTSFLANSTVAANLQVNGTLSAFITAVYQAAFLRAPSASEMTNWTNNFAAGWTKAGMLVVMSEHSAHRGYVNSLTLYALSNSAQPSPVNASNYRETDFTYDKDDRQTSSSIVGVETGVWSAGSWVSQTGNLTTGTVYDLNGNVIKETDANGNNTYTWYDKLGRRIAQVDAGGFMTAWTLDAEGNATQQIQYATALTGPFTAGGTPPAAPATNANDRTTAYTYDHDGQRLTETRKNATWSTVSGNSVGAASGDASVIYEYNGLGLVTKKIEATGDQTTWTYDAFGRLSAATTAAYSSWANTTAYNYDGLGNILVTIAGYGTSGAETTTFTYGAGGRLASKTDAVGTNVTTYGYDANGQTTVEQYTRAKSDGTTVTESKQYGYDGLGQKIFDGQATLTGGQWIFTQTVDTWYNAYGDVTARGVNTNRNTAKAQEFSDYDAAGRVWRSNMGDGVTKVYGYDKNGNATLQIQSQGTTDLRSIASLDAARAASGVTNTYSLYDARNELIDVKRPVSANLDGTVASGGGASIDTRGMASITFDSLGGQWNGQATSSIRVSLRNPAVSTANGGGAIHVTVSAPENTTQTATFASGTVDCGIYNMSFAMGSPPGQGYQGPKQVTITVTVTQDTASGTIQLASGGAPVVCYQGTHIIGTIPASPGRGLRVTAPNATAATLYVRPAGSTGGYTAVTTSQPVYDGGNNAVAGAFLFDLTTPPFNGTANSSWEVKYLATDASGKVVDAKTGTVTFDGSATPAPTATSFTSVPVFSASQSGGVWTLTTLPVAISYSDSTQTFNAFGDVISQTDARNTTTTYSYDAFGDLIQKVGAQVTAVGENGVASQVTPTDTYYYDKSGRQVGHRDANGNLTTQELLTGTGYDGTAGLTTKQYNPDGGVIQTAYDIFGNALTVTDATGAVTTNTYDKDNRLITVVHAARTSGDMSYTSGAGQLTDAYVYDSLGQRITHTNNVFGASIVETTDYDILGRVTKSVSFGGQTTTYNYTWNVMTASGRVTAGQANIGSWTKTTGAWGRTSSVVTDYFGKMASSSDFGGHTASYSYDLSGQLTHQGSSAGQSLDYVYTTSGQIGSVTDNATGIKAVYAYDANGNRTIEGYYRTGSTSGTYQNAVISYDALNRVSEIRDANADIVYAYDANGNRREVRTTYVNVDRLGYAVNSTTAPTSVQDYWYKYDSMNRFTLTKGILSGGAIIKSYTGVDITYNARGDRMSATYGSDGHVETYAYTADGYLTTVLIGGVLNAKRTTDVLGRSTGYTEYQSNGTTVLLTRGMTYDRANRVTSETDLTYNGGTTYTSQITNSYGAYNGGYYTDADQGVIMQSVNVQSQSGTTAQPVTTTTTYNYTWWDQAKSSTTVISGNDPNNANSYQWANGNASYSYDANGNLTQVADTGISRTMTYQTDSFGQVLTRKETNTSNAGAFRNFFYLNGHVVGDVGTDKLDSQTDYAQQLATDRSNAASAGSALTNVTATPIVALNANFDENYQAYNASSVGQAAGGYSVMMGDTLQSIAQNLWGDSSLWYILADANGLSAGATLAAGQSLIVPNKVTNLHNTSGVFKPYNASDALGNTTPTLPKEPQPPAPKKSGCGIIGDIIATVVSAVVQAVLTPIVGPQAAAGFADVAHQGIEILSGNQKKFNWAELGMAIVSASFDITKVVPQVPINSNNPFIKMGQTMLRSMENNALNQGVKIALGVQKKFDWKGVAAAGVQSGITFGLEKAVSPLRAAADRFDGKGPGSTSYNLNLLISGAVGVLSKAATNTIMTHSSFGKSLMNALPGAVGDTLGQIIAGEIKANGALKAKPQKGDGGFTPVPKAQNGSATSYDISARGLKAPNNWNFDVDASSYSDVLTASFGTSVAGQSTSALGIRVGDKWYPDANDVTSYNLARSDGIGSGQAVVRGGLHVENGDLLQSAVRSNSIFTAVTPVENLQSFDQISDGSLYRVFMNGDTHEVLGIVEPKDGVGGLLPDRKTFVRWQPVPEDVNPNMIVLKTGLAALDPTINVRLYGPSGDGGTWRAGDIPSAYSDGPLDEFDAVEYNKPHDIPSFVNAPKRSFLESAGIAFNAWARNTANTVTAGGANNLAAAMDAHSGAEYYHLLKEEHYKDLVANNIAPVSSFVGKATGIGASFLMPEFRGASIGREALVVGGGLKAETGFTVKFAESAKTSVLREAAEDEAAHIGAAWDAPTATKWNPSGKSQNCIATVASYMREKFELPFMSADDIELQIASVSPSLRIQKQGALRILEKSVGQEETGAVWQSPFKSDAPAGQYAMFFGENENKLSHVIHVERFDDGAVKMFDPQNGEHISMQDLPALRNKWGKSSSSPMYPYYFAGGK